MALPWIDLPDSLETLGNLAVQLQQLITAAISHPLLAVAAVLLSIGLIQLAADLVKRVIRASLTFILTLPLNLSQRLWKQITTNPESKQAQINQLLDRLETLRQEQDQVIAELKPLLSISPLAGSSSHPNGDTTTSLANPPSPLPNPPIS